MNEIQKELNKERARVRRLLTKAGTDIKLSELVALTRRKRTPKSESIEYNQSKIKPTRQEIELGRLQQVTKENIQKTLTRVTKTKQRRAKKLGISVEEYHIALPRAKKEKPRLTPEQLHDIRKKAGQKAWQTKRSKMTDRQYDIWKQEFARKMWIAKHPDLPEPPSVDKLDTSALDFVNESDLQPDQIAPTPYDIVAKIQAILEEIPEDVAYYSKSRRTFVHIETNKFELLNILKSNAGDYGQAYSNYLADNESELVHYLTVSIFDSDGNEVMRGVSNAMRIISGDGQLSYALATVLGDLEDYWDD